MKNFTRFLRHSATPSAGLCLGNGILLALLGLASGPGMAQIANRPAPTDPIPTDACSPAYQQKAGATYVAANHLSGNSAATDIGTTGVTTVIDAGLWYGGTLVFNGSYHVRGTVRFINGTVELRPGTVFYVEGLSGQNSPPTPIPVVSTYPFYGIGMESSTFIEVANATLELTGAVIQSTCPRAWGGINLLDNGRIRTRADAAAVAPAGRSLVRDAFIGVHVAATSSGRSTGEYYLTDTDFLNNYVGVFDYCKTVARAGEGVHYCSFGTNANLKSPINSSPYQITGVWLGPFDQQFYYNNYAAASIDHSTFHHLDSGVYGEGALLHISDNVFDYIWYAAVNLEEAQAAFFMKPMTVERNTITVRGANPRGNLTTWGILGSPYAQGNIIRGDAADPAGNGVEQVGMFLAATDNSTQTGNTFERLDVGIEASIDDAGGYERDLSGNLFRDVVAGIRFYNYFTAAMSGSALHVRCNSFENPSNLAGAVALDIEGPNFPQYLGTLTNGNGNRFVTPGLPSIEPIDNRFGHFFTYFAFGSSSQESFSQATQSTGYTVMPTGGSAATACTSAGYTNGINNRGAIKQPISPGELRNAFDSLRMAIPVSRRAVLVNTLIAATAQNEDFAGLETYFHGLPAAAGWAHSALGGWLLHHYRAVHHEPGAQRVRTALLARHSADAEVKSMVQLSDALKNLADPTAPSAPAAVASLLEVAGSGTASARVACPVARRYAPACPCRYAGKSTKQALAERGNSTNDKAAVLGAPYPNPADQTVRVAYALPVGSGPARLAVRNALGQLVQRVALPGTAGETVLDVRGLPAGLYQLSVVGAGHGTATQRLSVTH